VPEGDSIHKVAARLGPLLIGERVRALALPRRVESSEGIAGQAIRGSEMKKSEHIKE